MKKQFLIIVNNQKPGLLSEACSAGIPAPLQTRGGVE